MPAETVRKIDKLFPVPVLVTRLPNGTELNERLIRELHTPERHLHVRQIALPRLRDPEFKGPALRSREKHCVQVLLFRP